MKYFILNQIASFLDQNAYKISSISRSADLCLNLEFAGKNGAKPFALCFDMSKSDSSIYSAKKSTNKEYKAPFDITLKKRLTNAKITSAKVVPNNRILEFIATQQGSYKELKSRLIFEFTGRFTNVIITDESGVVLGALHLFKNTKRDVVVGRVLPALEPHEIKEAPSGEIKDFYEFFASEENRIKNKALSTLKQNKIASVDKKIANIDALLAKLPKKAQIESECELVFAKASALKAHLFEIKDFERDFSLDGLEFQIDKPARIACDELFKSAKKLRQKAANISKEEQNLNEKKDFLLGLKEAILSEENAANLEVLVPKKRAAKKSVHSDFCEDFYKGLYKISVGKNERGNAWLLENAKKDDTWFHLQGYKGAHVIIKSNKQKLNDEIIAFASRMCVLFSGHKRGSFQVDFTKRSNVKVVSGAFVNYINYDTVGVKI